MRAHRRGHAQNGEHRRPDCRVSAGTSSSAAWISPPAPADSNVATIIARAEAVGRTRNAERTCNWRHSRSACRAEFARCRKRSRSPSGCRRSWASAPPAVSSSCWRTAPAATSSDLAADRRPSWCRPPARAPELGNVINTFRANVPAYKVDDGSGQAADAGRSGHRRLQRAADLSRRPVRERLQRLRPHLAGAGAGRAGVPQPALPTSTASTCAAATGDMVPLGTLAPMCAHHRARM